MQNSEKELKVNLWNAVFNKVYKSWVTLVSSVFHLLTTLLSKIFREE